MRELLRSNLVSVTTDNQGRFWISSVSQAIAPVTGSAVASCVVIAFLADKRNWSRRDVLWAQQEAEKLEAQATRNFG